MRILGRLHAVAMVAGAATVVVVAGPGVEQAQSAVPDLAGWPGSASSSYQMEGSEGDDSEGDDSEGGLVTPGDQPISAQLGTMVVDEALLLVDESFVDIVAQVDANRFEVGVYGLQEDEAFALAEALNLIAPVDVVSRPVRAGDLEAAALAANARFAEHTFAVGIDYIGGGIVLSVEPDSVAEITAALGGTPLEVEGLDDATVNRITVTVEEGSEPIPADAYNTTPLKAGKYIYTAVSACTSNALVQNSGGTRYSMTAGHCDPVVGQAVYFEGMCAKGTPADRCITKRLVARLSWQAS